MDEKVGFRMELILCKAYVYAKGCRDNLAWAVLVIIWSCFLTAVYGVRHWSGPGGDSLRPTKKKPVEINTKLELGCEVRGEEVLYCGDISISRPASFPLVIRNNPPSSFY